MIKESSCVPPSVEGPCAVRSEINRMLLQSLNHRLITTTAQFGLGLSTSGDIFYNLNTLGLNQATQTPSFHSGVIVHGPLSPRVLLR